MSDSSAGAPIGTLDAIALIRAADGVKQTNGALAAVPIYDIWIETHGDDPLLYAVLFNFSVLLTEVGDLNGARRRLEHATVIKPDFVAAYINLGRIYERMGSANLALLQWSAALGKLPQLNSQAIIHKTTALNQSARVLESLGQDAPAESMLRQSLELDPSQREATQHLIALRQRQCEWPVIQPWDRLDAKTLMGGISPLSLAAYADDPMFQLAAAWRYSVEDVGSPPFVTDHDLALSRDAAPIRIGYLSSDLRHHAIGYLTAEIYGLHDRAAVEVYVYYCGPKLTDPLQKRIKAQVDQWTDISEMTDEAAARLIAQDGVQILVDINGYTRDGRTKLVALRPAPVIVNWLGFPGTTGSPYHHYIIADDWIIPPGEEIYYSETVLRLACYQPIDRRRKVAPLTVTRADAGLPDDAVVFCCFNGAQKINRLTLDRWCAVLEETPGGVLWLLAAGAEAEERLRTEIRQRGVDPSRVVFAEKMANPEHLARYALADVFLDSLPYGAHTTASDALWMGLPVVTLSGRAFAARVCGSLVRAAGLPDLVCETSEAFIRTASALGNDPARRATLRDHLLGARETSTLFDTPALVKRLEALYRDMWNAAIENRLPRPDLRNLDVYFEVGAAQDYDAFDLLDEPDYRRWWHEKLLARDRLRAIAPDDRLWKSEAI